MEFDLIPPEEHLAVFKDAPSRGLVDVLKHQERKPSVDLQQLRLLLGGQHRFERFGNRGGLQSERFSTITQSCSVSRYSSVREGHMAFGR